MPTKGDGCGRQIIDNVHHGAAPTAAATATAPAAAAPLLDVGGLSVRFATDYGEVRAVEDVSFTIRAGETLAVVGESGSGKSVTSLAIMGLLPEGRARLTADRLVFDGTELTALTPAARRRACGSRMAMIFQEPMTSLDPVYPVD